MSKSRCRSVIAPKIAVAPQPIVMAYAPTSFRPPLTRRESVEFIEKNTDLPAVDGQQVSRCAQIRKPSSIPRSRLHRLPPPPTPGREELKAETELCGARTKGGSEHGRRHPDMIEPHIGLYKSATVEILINWFDHNGCFCVSAAGKLHDAIAARTSTIPQALSRMHHFPQAGPQPAKLRTPARGKLAMMARVGFQMLQSEEIEREGTEHRDHREYERNAHCTPA